MSRRARLLGRVVAVVALAAPGVLVPRPALALVPSSEVQTLPLHVGQGTEVEPFTMLAVSWVGDPGSIPEVQVRTDGAWHAGPDDTPGPDDGPDGRTDGARGGPDGAVDGADPNRSFSDPTWVGEADAVRLVATEGAEQVRVHLVREALRPAAAVATDAAGAEVPGDGPAITSRATWGARPPRSANAVAVTLKVAVVHHTAGTNDYGPGDVPAILRGIQAFHQDSRGWNDIAYNFLVDRWGGIWEGRAGGIGAPVVGSHAAGVNTGSVGVAVLGEFSTSLPTTATVESVGDLLGWKLALHGVDPNGTAPLAMGSDNRFPEGTVVDLPRIIGHQQVGFTDCPGRIMELLAAIRARAAGRAAYVRGSLDVIRLVDRAVEVGGWALDRRSAAPISVAVTVGGSRVATLAADGERPDVAAAVPGAGPRHGFAGTVPVGPGTATVCAYGLDASYGATTLLGCRTFSRDPAPGEVPLTVRLDVGGLSDGFARGVVPVTISASGGTPTSLELRRGAEALRVAAPGPDGATQVQLDTATFPDGRLELRGRATDTAGVTSDGPVTVLTVDNTRPGVLVMAPTRVRGGSTITVGVGAADAGAVRATFLALGDRVVGGFTGAGARAMRVTLPRSGRHRLLAATIDVAGNFSFSNQVWVTTTR